jgi:hypothetical protein
MSEANEDSTQRIGDFLVRIGAMTESQVAEVLERQAGEPGRLFGEIAIEMEFINDAAVDNFLANRQAK